MTLEISVGDKTEPGRKTNQDPQDITQIRSELAKAQAFLRNTSDGMCILNAEFRVIEVSTLFCRTLGYREEDLLGATPALWDAHLSEETIAAMIRGLFETGERAEFETVHRRKDGSTFPVAVSALPLTFDGAPLLFCLTRDISAQKDLEDRLRAALAVAEAENRAKSEFLANMSHELRTPLNSVIGYSEMMSLQVRGPLSAAYREDAKIINRSGRLLLSHINTILDIAKIEAGKLELDPVDCDVAQIVQDVLSMLTVQIDPARVKLSTRIEGTPIMRADRDRLTDVLINVVGNAIKFTQDGSISITVTQGARHTIITVTDTGIGMTDEQTARALLPFEQVHGTSLSRRYGGTGLGLTLVNRLVALHGGDVRIHSRVGHGTTVALRFPFSGCDLPR